MRRLVSLDCVRDDPHLPWLPTEPEKVGAFETLGIERRLLPSRLYRGAAGSTRRYFPLKLPVVLDADRALFVYVDPGHDTSKALRSWGVAHRRLWMALAERQRSVEVIASARTKSSTGPRQSSAAGAGPPAAPNPTPRSMKNSPASSGRSFGAHPKFSRSSADSRPR